MQTFSLNNLHAAESTNRNTSHCQHDFTQIGSIYSYSQVLVQHSFHCTLHFRVNTGARVAQDCISRSSVFCKSRKSRLSKTHMINTEEVVSVRADFKQKETEYQIDSQTVPSTYLAVDWTQVKFFFRGVLMFLHFLRGWNGTGWKVVGKNNTKNYYFWRNWL